MFLGVKYVNNLTNVKINYFDLKKRLLLKFRKFSILLSILLFVIFPPIIYAYVYHYEADNVSQMIINVPEALYLYVNSYDASQTQWSRIGTNPYIASVDYPTNYVSVQSINQLVGDFGFQDSGKSTQPINNVTIQLYSRQSANGNMEVYIWDGASWSLIGQIKLTSSFRWENYTATSVLNTWAKIDGAKMYIKSKSQQGTTEVDCSRILVFYS